MEIIYHYLTPEDLLSLYTSNKQHQENINQFIYKKYHLLFIPWLHHYYKSIIPSNQFYLYSIDTPADADNRLHSIETMYVMKKQMGLSNMIFCYAVTLFNDVPDQLLNAYMSLYNAAHFLSDDGILYYFEDHPKTLQQIEDGLPHFYHSQLKSTQYFFSQNDLMLYTYFLPLPYKPSQIAEAVSYLMTGTYKIYSMAELTPICKKIMAKYNLSPFLNKLVLSAQKLIKYSCMDTEVVYKREFKSVEPWHLGAYEEIKVLGQGAYGKVTHVKSCHQDYVIKSNFNEDYMSILKEIAALQLIKSDYVIQLCGYEFKNVQDIDIILPYMNASLTQLVDNNQFNKNQLIKYYKQFLLGIKACHDVDIIHRDIKTDNIVYHADTDTFKLIDFGLCVLFSNHQHHLDPSLACTMVYRAPEAWWNQSYNFKIDIWALGVVFYYIFTKDYFITEVKTAVSEIYNLFGDDKKSPDIKLIEIFGEYYSLIMPCFTINPALRPDTSQLLSIIG